MPGSLPTEIWVQILSHLPATSLRLIKLVNRALCQICTDILCRVLDMTMNIRDQDGDDEIEILTKRLEDAKRRPHHIKKLCLSGNRVNIREYETIPSPPRMLKLKQKTGRLWFLRRLFRAKHDSVLLSFERSPRLHIRSALDKARNIENAISSLIPSLSCLQELDFHQLSGWEGGWYSNFNLALSVASPQLTVLSLRFSLTSGGTMTTLGIKDTMFSIALPSLPSLRALKIYVNVYPSNDFETTVGKFMAASPLLREIQYNIEADPYSVLPTSQVILSAPAHSHLKAFKWIMAPSPMPVTPLFTAYASQYEIVHLNPVPSIDVIRLLNINQLVELRVNLSWMPNDAGLFSLLTHATQLDILEIHGWPYEIPEESPSDYFPETGLAQLRTLYLGIQLRFFSPQMLRSLASKMPNLHTLAFISQIGLIFKPDRIFFDHISHPFSNSPLLEWKLCDFGVVLRSDGRLGTFQISDLIPLLRMISRMVPSITSFYGTGSLHLWEGMENGIHESWGGELWGQRDGRW
ncbi:hypothetical protein DL96DRAFT_1635785 [Flagelloscypha sp. PMI_526]|nr:hypothetical protein DL96DRAFT_1635785 [Flagelloscypha sp. PMI_526]